MAVLITVDDHDNNINVRDGVFELSNKLRHQTLFRIWSKLSSKLRNKLCDQLFFRLANQLSSELPNQLALLLLNELEDIS